MERIAAYPGTFDPITNGHADLIRRVSTVFKRIVVLVSADTRKKPLFNAEERAQMVREAISSHYEGVEVEVFHGLLVHAIEKHRCRIIIRGLRAVSDFEYESQMALMNRRIMKDVETLFMISKEEYSYVSSSFVKEIASLGGDITSMVPEGVARRLGQIYTRKTAFPEE